MNSRWAALVAASLVAFASLVITWQVRQYDRGENGKYPTVAECYLLGKHLSGITNIVDRSWANIAASGTCRYFDLVLPTNASVFMTDMTGPSNYAKIGYYFFVTYHLFPREVGVSVDQPTRMTYNEFPGRTSKSDQEILTNGFNVRLDATGSQWHLKALRDLPMKSPANPAWFNSGRDTVIAFMLPLLTALAGMWLVRFLFPTLGVQMPLLEQLAYGLGLGMMVVAALTLGVKLCGYSGRGLILSVTALGSIAEIWHHHKAFWAKIAGSSWKLVKSPITIVFLVAGLLVFLVLFRLAGLQGLIDGDAMRWMLKAKIMHLCTGNELVRWFSTPGLAHAHLDYPTLVPSLHAATYDSLGHVDEFVTKFWPTWMLLFLIAALASLNRAHQRTAPERSKVGARLGVQHQPQHVKNLRGIKRKPTGQFCEAAATGQRHSRAPGAVRGYAPLNRTGNNWRHVSSFALLGILLLPAVQEYVQWEGSTLPMIFFTVLGCVQCAFWLAGKDRARLGLGLTLLFGAAMSKFEGFIFLALVGSWILLLPSARPSLKPSPRLWWVLGFWLLAALPFICLRVQIPSLHFESGWTGYALHNPGSMFSNWPSLFLILLARLFVNSDFANWSGEGGQLHWIGQWHGFSSVYSHMTLGLAWLCLLMTVALWFAVPARRHVIVWILAMFVGAMFALSAVFVSFVSIKGLSEVIGYTNDGTGGRYLLPVLLAWFSTILTMFFADPSSATTADRDLPPLKHGYWLAVGALLIVALGVFVLPKNESPSPKNPLPSAAATSSPNVSNVSEINPPVDPDLQARMDLATQLDSAGKFAEALQESREAVRLYPNDPHALNNLAWRLATIPKLELRNGREAVQFASQAVELTGQQQPICIRTLAAAYAQDGQLAKAVEMAKKARAVALLAGMVEEAAINEDLLKQFSAAASGLTNGP